MPLPEALRRALHDAHDCESAVRLLNEHFLERGDAACRAEYQRHFPDADPLVGVPGRDLRAIANAVAEELAGDAHQLAKLMAALWRGPTVEHRLVAGLSGDALGEADLKALLRFLQKAEKRLRDGLSCDVLVRSMQRHIQAHPELFLREAENRLRSRQPLVHRLGVRIVEVLQRSHPEQVRQLADHGVSMDASELQGFTGAAEQLLWGEA